VRGRDQPNIMAPGALQFQHDLCEPLKTNFPAAVCFAVLANLVILTVYAFQIAIPEKNITGSVIAADYGLFPHVPRIGCNDWKLT